MRVPKKLCKRVIVQTAVQCSGQVSSFINGFNKGNS
jgi:hypothetical protein